MGSAKGGAEKREELGQGRSWAKGGAWSTDQVPAPSLSTAPALANPHHTPSTGPHSHLLSACRQDRRDEPVDLLHLAPQPSDLVVVALARHQDVVEGEPPEGGLRGVGVMVKCCDRVMLVDGVKAVVGWDVFFGGRVT